MNFGTYMLMMAPAFALALWAQFKVKNTFSRYSKVRSSRGFTGAEVARRLLDMRGLGDVPVEATKGSLTDHYDPRSRKLKLSEGVYDSASVAALGVAAHETGHALQHADAYGPLMLRTNLVPVANFGSTLAFPLFIIGLFVNVGWLMDVGIIFFSAAVVFTLITLPVEYNASSRALALLREGGYLDEQEMPHARTVLNAAAWTYVAAALMAVLQLARLLMLRGSRD